MTFADKTIVPGRQAASILELDLDGCARSYGVSPCTATLALTNFCRESAALATSPWSQTNITVNVDQITNPVNGATDVDEVVEDGSVTTQHRASNFTSGNLVVPSQVHTLSAYAFQGVGTRNAHLVFFNGADILRATFDLSEQTVTDSSAGGSAVLSGVTINAVPGFPGWFRLTLSGVFDPADDTPTNVNFGTQLANVNQIFYTGDSASSIYYWGVQIRPGLLPGKYVETTTAAIDGMGTVDDLCFNTFGTCQDTANYLKEVRTLRFVDANVVRPVDLIEAFPSITSVRYGSTRINPGGKFSVRGTVTVVLQDFSHNDGGGLDDYQGERSYDPETQGSFFGKLKERSKYYVGRPMRVLEGYLDAPFSLTNFRTREYIIENIAGPTADGRVTITGKDVLALARDDRAKCPTATTGTLAATITDAVTSLTVSTGDGAQYDPTTVDKHIRIDDEIILVGGRSGDVLNTLTRGVGGTTAAAHTLGAAIQACKTYEDEPVIDVIDDLLVNFSNIPSSFIPTTDWEAEETASLSGYNMETIISAPTGVTKLLQEICAITLIDLWYSDVDQEIKLKLQTPFTAASETWTDDDNFLMDSVKVKDLNEQRLSRVLIYYGMRNYAEKLTEPENYELVHFEIEADKEGVNKYADEKIRTIFSRWFDASNSTQVALTSQRLLERFGITPVEISFDIDAKDVETLQTGDVYDAVTRVIQDVDGNPKTTRFQIIETKPRAVGSRYNYTSLAFFQDPTPESLTITTDQVDYDVFVEAGGPPSAVDMTLTINTTINVDGSTGNPAITTEGFHPDSTLKIINNGNIRGHGGAGGAGGAAEVHTVKSFGCITTGSEQAGSVGQPGGDAINTTIDLTIDNTNGNIWAGAGGGGGGGGFGDALLVLDVVETSYGGGGGGGGIGADTANGGAGGDATVVEGGSCILVARDGFAGAAGSTSAAGAGGNAGGSEATVGDGGAGGAAWGDDGIVGDDATDPTPDVPGGAGGAGGYAVRLNGNSITWVAGNTAAKVKGDVA